jgi:hypothetical protein
MLMGQSAERPRRREQLYPSRIHSAGGAWEQECASNRGMCARKARVGDGNHAGRGRGRSSTFPNHTGDVIRVVARPRVIRAPARKPIGVAVFSGVIVSAGLFAPSFFVLPQPFEQHRKRMTSQHR